MKNKHTMLHTPKQLFPNQKTARQAASSPLVIGTLLLTASGVISRMIGFFYKIFLSRTIGAEALGLYQLVFPLLGLSIAISCSGIQTAISKFVADAVGSCSSQVSGEKQAKRYLFAGLFLSTGLSVIFSLILYFFAEPLATSILGEARCNELLRILSFSLLPASIHGCINGYYYGKKKAAVPSICQLAEQIARVAGVYLIYLIHLEKGESITAVHAAWGLVIGEICGLIVGTTALAWQKLPNSVSSGRQHAEFTFRQSLRSVGAMAVPLTANQALIHLCSSIENLLIPQQLQKYGNTPEEALAIYGVFSGMAISVIFFPSVLTNSLSVLLLPSISEANAKGNHLHIQRTISRALFYGLIFGFLFTFLFLVSGNFIGNVIFQNSLAGTLIRKLSWICPMMYVYGLLSSILHGLGKANYVLFINLLASAIRIGIIYFLVPVYGLYAVLWGMLLSQLFSSLAAIFLLLSKK